MHQRKLQTITALVAGTSLMLGIASAQAAPDKSPDEVLPGITDSRELTSDPIVAGVLKTNGGAPVTEPQQVVLHAWPSNDILGAMQDGESVKLVPVAKATTEPDGTFKIKIDNTEILKAIKSDSNQVNFTLSSESSSGQYSYSFSREMVETSNGVKFREVGAERKSEKPAEAPAQTVPNAGPLNLTISPIASNASAEVGSGDVGAATSDDYRDKACYTYKQYTYSPTWVTVGQSFVNTTGVTSDFVYSYGADSSLGIGVSTSGAYGSYSNGGTISASSTASVNFPTQGSYTAKRMRTQFSYAKFLIQCRYSSGYVYSEEYQLRPVSYAGGAQVVNNSYYPQANYCTYYAAGSAFTKNRTNAIQWTDGADTSGIIGISLSARTGYSNEAKARFNFSSARSLCGTYDYPGGTPYFMVATW